ncbi:M14 family zinc carboxypeptidase [Kushneria aurantia]|uniref:M14 family zinc carboxypeptidase n=1 Tax=Kushneria aurantia TaxID=504092 RepID=A0ABV6FZT0_9GAMM|nr:M14 family zinc carboxypeptidase [Kushneria aurantia]
MILIEKTYPGTFDALFDQAEGDRIETWTFDDGATRARAETEFAEKGIVARCRSAYKPLVSAFLEDIETDGLVSASVIYPRHPAATEARFLLESYPLAALYPQVDFTFAPGLPSDEIPGYKLVLSYKNGECRTRYVLAPNRLHEDFAGERALSPCGWLITGGNAYPLSTAYETIFFDAMTAIRDADWGDSEPFFEELNIAVTLPTADEPLAYGDEVMSLREALHEEFYFSCLEVFQQRSGRPRGDRHLQPGQIVPEICYGDAYTVKVETRPYDGSSFSDYMQPSCMLECPLSRRQIDEELATLGGVRFEAFSVAGRRLEGGYVAGTDRPMIISAGQHANETSSPAGTLRAAQQLAQNQGAHFTLCPLENPDGYALHQRLIVDNPRHMHHAARYTALGDDLEYREGVALHEKMIRLEAERLAPDALLHLNLHGYPAHEWTRPLSGYIPRGFEMWTIPKGFFLMLRYAPGWAAAGRALLEAVTLRLGRVPGLHAFNEAQIAVFDIHAGAIGFEMINGFPCWLCEDDRHRVAMTLITEYPDETIYGNAFRAGVAAQEATVLAAYEALQTLDLSVNGAMK